MAEPTLPTNPVQPPSGGSGEGLIAIITRATAAVRSLGAELKATTQTAEETAVAAKKAKDAASELTGGRTSDAKAALGASYEQGNPSDHALTGPGGRVPSSKGAALGSVTTALTQSEGRLT